VTSTHTRIKTIKPAAVAAVLALAACSGSGTSPSSVTTVNVSKNVLQLAVGTANVYGDLGAGGGAFTGLNVAVTYRQPAGSQKIGDSATLVNSPTLTIPGTLAGPVGTSGNYSETIETGPASSEVGGHALTATPQSGSAAVTTFGTSGGAFGLGLAPFNYNEGGAPDNVAPYVVPLYDALAGTMAGDPNAFVPWGGPPAFDPAGDGTGVRDESVPSGTLGVPEGLDVFESIAPSAGTYTLSVSVPANTGTTTQSQTATLNSTAALPAWVLPTPTLDGSGGATIPVTLPAGVTEAYVQVTDFGPAQPASGSYASCNGSSTGTPTYYTIELKASGNAVLPDTDGPGKTPSLCTSAQDSATNSTSSAAVTTTGDQFTVQLIGFDYPWFEASYPNSSGNPAPTIAGSNGQADVTISSAAAFTQTAGAAPTAVRTKFAFSRTPAATRRR
jgi:hypothetical protein